jgi:hypothetical protein
MLLTKLEYYGIRRIREAWIKLYVSYQLQFVEIFKTNNKGKKPTDILLNTFSPASI